MHRTVSKRRQIVAGSVLGVMLLAPSNADAARLWVAYDNRGITGSCQTQVESFFDCILGASNYNDIIESYAPGRSLTWGASAVLTPSCDNGTQPTQNASASDAAVLQCIVDQTHWPVANGDVILFYANGGGCHGRNRHGVSINVNGAMVSVRLGFNWARDNCACATFTGEHEAFEATAHALAADCCNGQYSVRGHCCIPGGPQGAGYDCGSVTPYNWSAHPWGFYQLSCGDAAHGGVATYRGQYLPTSLATAAQQYDATSCTGLQIDNSDVCAWSRDARMAGVCNATGNVETCVNGRHVQDCGGRGCTSAPTPHCNAAGGFAARCTAAYATAMCAGATQSATIRCVNSGDVPWDSMLRLSLPSGQTSSAFEATTWVSARVPAMIAPAAGSTLPIARGEVGVFTFDLTAPNIAAARGYNPTFALRDGGGMYYSSTDPADLSLHISVEPCSDGGLPTGDDAGAEDVLPEPIDDIEEVDAVADSSPAGDSSSVPDSSTHADARVGDVADASTPPTTQPGGCGCRAATSHAPRSAAFAAVGLAIAMASVRRRRRLFQRRQ